MLVEGISPKNERLRPVTASSTVAELQAVIKNGLTITARQPKNSTEMDQSIQLLHRALEREPSQAFWCKQLGVSRSALAVAKLRGRLSPSLAGNLCRLLNLEDELEHWVAIAGLEAEPPTYARSKIQSLLRTIA